VQQSLWCSRAEASFLTACPIPQCEIESRFQEGGEYNKEAESLSTYPQEHSVRNIQNHQRLPYGIARKTKDLSVKLTLRKETSSHAKLLCVCVVLSGVGRSKQSVYTVFR
jgi:hypothetical protein